MNLHVKTVCRIGQLWECCRYLTAGPHGFECAKLHPGLRALIDERVLEGKIKSLGDHCEGRSAEFLHQDGGDL